jgi:hypothetical protein
MEEDKTNYNYLPSPKSIHTVTDKNNFVYIAFLFFGVGVLLPWNAVLTSLDFFGH